MALFLGWLIGFGFWTTWTGCFIGVGPAYILANLAGNRKVAMASGAEKAKALEFSWRRRRGGRRAPKPR